MFTKKFVTHGLLKHQIYEPLLIHPTKHGTRKIIFKYILTYRSLDPSWLVHLPLILPEEMPKLEGYSDREYFTQNVAHYRWQNPSLHQLPTCREIRNKYISQGGESEPVIRDTKHPVSSDSITMITEHTKKMRIRSQPCKILTPKRSTTRTARKSKYYTPYTSCEEATTVNPSQITLNQVLKQTKIGTSCKDAKKSRKSRRRENHLK